MGKLYPPNINGTIPAFYGTTLVVPFSLNKAVALAEIKDIICKIKTVNGVLKETLYSDNPETIINSQVTFTTKTEYKVGQSYKIQIAFVDMQGNAGYYSTVGVAKYTTQPNVYIEGLGADVINSHNYYYTGVYSQKDGDTTEKMYSYRFRIYNDNDQLVDDTGYKLHNVSKDIHSYEAHEEYHINQDLEENKSFFIVFTVKTINGLEISSKRYRITQKRSVKPEIKLDFHAELDRENGFIKLVFKNCTKSLISGSFLVSRASSDEHNAWNDFRRFSLHAITPESFELIDCTVAHGVRYKYSIQQYNKNRIYSERIISNEVLVDFEDAFLYDGDRQLRIRFNPKVSSFKIDYADQKTDTIGSKNPFIIRNGNMAYREFPISGLISYKMDEDNNMFMNLAEDLGITTPSTDLTAENMAAERIFKMEVLQWLNDGKPKLFRSPAEGNFIVRLMNVSLSPNDTLGRMLHTFSATAYEIAEFNFDNLSKYKITDTTESVEEQMQWSSRKLQDFEIMKKEDPKALEAITKDITSTLRSYRINDQSRLVYEVSFTDMLPGSMIYIENESIVIGATGAYSASSSVGFTYIGIDSRYCNQGMCTYSYKSHSISNFGLIYDLQVEDIPTRQFIGNTDLGDNVNIFDYVQDVRTDLVTKGMIRFIKRPLYYLYVNINLNEEEFTPGALYDYYSGMDCLEDEIINPLTDLDPFAIYQIRIRRNDYRNYRSEGYYIDRTLERFAPFTNYYIDGKVAVETGTMNMMNVSDDVFNVTIDNEVINLDEIEKYVLSSPEKFSNVSFGNGVICEFAYSVQIKTFSFDIYNAEVSSALADYKRELAAYKKAIQTDTPSAVLVGYKKQLARNYNIYLEKLQAAIKEYQEAYGLS